MENQEKILSAFFATVASATSVATPAKVVEANTEVEFVQEEQDLAVLSSYDLTKNYKDAQMKQNESDYVVEINKGIRVVPEKEYLFPYEELDFPKLSEYSLFSIENITDENIIQTKENTVLYMIPLDRDQEVSEVRDVKQFVVKPGMNFEIAQNRVLINSEGDLIEVSMLANTFGGKNFVAGIVNNAVIDGKRTEFVTNNSDKIESTATYIVVEDTIYPNKISNLLKAFAHVTQEGQLKAGEEYSYVSMIGLDHIGRLKEYDFGRTGGGGIVYAGGVCAGATGVSSLLAQVEGVEIGKLSVDRWTHPIPYAQGPFSARWEDVDAAVSYDSSTKEIFDFVWKMGRDGYIKVDVEIVPSGIAYAETDKEGLGNVSDVSAIFSLSFTEEEPLGQEEMLWNLREEYKAFRDTRHEDLLPDQEKLSVKTYEQVEKNVKRTVDLLYLLKFPEGSDTLDGVYQNIDLE